MKHIKMNIELYEHDIVYLLNCICITKTLLINKKNEFYKNYFKEDKLDIYINDLTLMQKLIGYKANKVFYNYTNFDLFIGQTDYINIGDKEFKNLFSKKRLDRLKEISREIKYRNKISKKKIIQEDSKNSFYKKKWYIIENNF